MIKFCRYFSLLLLSAFFYCSAFSQNCTVNAGVATTICPGSAFVLSGSASGLFASGGTAVWSQISGPAITLSATTISGSTATATVTGYAAGSVYGFRLTGKCTDGSLVYQDVLYTASNAIATNAGPDIVACPGTVSMAANALASGETGSWTLISGVSSTLPSPATSPTATLTLPATTSIGATTYRWTVVNGSCTSYDDVIVTNRGGISPVLAGPNQTVGCYATSAAATLAASFAGNGTGNQLGTWTLVSGPSTPTFANIHVNNTVVSNLIQGVYKLRWTVSGVCTSGSADITITVGAGTQGVTNVPATATNIYYCDGRTSTSLTAPTPNYTNETAAWTQTTTQANAGVTISNPSSPTTTISGLNGTTTRSFTYTITNNVTGCSNSAVYNIYFSVAPSVTVNGGSPNFLVACDAVTASIPYTVAGGNLTQWALVNGPAGSTLGGSAGTSSYTTASSSPQTIAGLTVAGTYVIRFKRTTSNGSGSCSDAYQDISINVTKSVTLANAGTKQVLACNTFSTNLQANAPTNGTGKWTQLSGPNTATIADVTLANTSISSLVAGAYTFRWIISGGEGSCGNSQSDVSVIVASPTPTTSAAGSNMAACYATPVRLTGNQPAATETGTWTVTPSTGVVFSSINDPNAVVTGLSNNTAYTFTWTIANSCGSSASSVILTTSNTAGAMQATAGPDQCLSAGTTSFTLAGNTPATGETGVWTLLSGAPNTPTFTNAYNTTVSGAANGTYKFEWSLNKGGCASTRDTVFITISSAATTANAGTAITQCGFANITLNGNNPTVGTGTWTQTAGPGGAVITNPALRNTTVSGLVVGRYIFRWTITNGACSSNYAEVTVNISTPPTTAAAGPDQSLCSTTSATLAANTITVGRGLWSVISGPNTPTFASAANSTTTISNLVTGTYVLRWTATNGLYCSPSTDDVNIYVTQNATAGANQSLCSQSSTVLTGNEGSSGTWNQVGTSPATATINTNSNNTAIVTGLTAGGVYTFRYTIAAVGACAQTTADMTVTVTPAPSAAIAGDDVNYCLAAGTGNATVTLGANSTAPTSGTGTWSVASKPSGSPTPTFSNVNNINATFSNLVNGLYILEWNVTNGGCTVNKDVVRVTIYGEPSAAAAGPDQTAACSSQVTLAATAPTVGIGTWSQTGGPTLPAGSIDAPNLPSTQILNTSAGNIYTFTWTVTNGNICAAKTDDVMITVVADAPTTANAGAAQSLCGQYTTTLAANAVAAGETGTWTIISKPAGAADAVFTGINNPTSGLSGLVQGSYTVRWTITNAGICTSAADVLITVTDPPTVAYAGANASYCLFSPVVLAATPVTSGTGTWSVTSKPASSPAPVFSSVNAANASLTGLVEGAYTFKWSSTNGSCPASESQVNINIYKCEIGVTKTAGTPVLQADGSYNVTFTFNVTNTGSAMLNGVQVTDDLNASFTGKNFTISSKTASGMLVINPNFNGTADKNLLAAAASTLAASATGTIVIVVNIVL